MDQTTSLWDRIDRLLIEMVEAHQKKLLECGRRIVPRLTPEDMLQPNDYPELENHPYFRYEEGMVAGIQTVHMALRAMKNDECG